MDTTASPRVLVIGLDPYRVCGPWDPEPVARAIESGLAKFAERGVGVETCLIGLMEVTTLQRASGVRCELIRGSASPSAVACGTRTAKSNSLSSSST